jgi:SagB-type dehydrogenase family enzyme
MENTIGRQFIEMTKYKNLEPSQQSQGDPWPEIELPLPEGAEVISLPAGQSLALEPVVLINLVEKRETFRNYSDKDLSLEELAYLLWGTQGVKSILGDKPVTKRTVPSAGSRHAFETWLLINRVASLQPGLYRYMALSHQLARLPGYKDIQDKLTEACLKQQHVRNSAVTFIWVADQQRMTWRYCQRGYRYMYLDAGHVCQNLYLLAEAAGCGVCAIAAYDDDLVNAALDLDGKEQFAIYLASLGKREK